jgi:hypothetical protein
MRVPCLAITLLGAAFLVSGCATQTVNGLPLIATDNDQSVIDRAPLPTGATGIVYDPDGCQAWLIDDGLEGYSSNRLDPSTGLPICDGQFPPGTVVNNYRTNNVIELNPS